MVVERLGTKCRIGFIPHVDVWMSNSSKLSIYKSTPQAFETSVKSGPVTVFKLSVSSFFMAGTRIILIHSFQTLNKNRIQVLDLLKNIDIKQIKIVFTVFVFWVLVRLRGSTVWLHWWWRSIHDVWFIADLLYQKIIDWAVLCLASQLSWVFVFGEKVKRVNMGWYGVVYLLFLFRRHQNQLFSHVKANVRYKPRWKAVVKTS